MHHRVSKFVHLELNIQDRFNQVDIVLDVVNHLLDVQEASEASPPPPPPPPPPLKLALKSKVDMT